MNAPDEFPLVEVEQVVLPRRKGVSR